MSRGVVARAVHLVRATTRDAIDDDLAGEAAKMAYYFFLSLFPLVLVIFAATGLVGGDAAFVRITHALEASVPDYAWQFVRDLIREVTARRRPGILSIGVVLTLWAASNGIAALTGGLNAIYDVREERRWWKRRVIALCVLIGGVILIVAATAVFLPGLAWAEQAGLGDGWRIARWPLAFGFVTGTIWLAYYYLPAREQRHVRLETLVGAAAATTLWLLAIAAFQYYVANFGRYSRVYGAVGAVIVLLIWFYITAFAVLLGGELGAHLERERRRTGEQPGASRAAGENDGRTEQLEFHASQ